MINWFRKMLRVITAFFVALYLAIVTIGDERE